MTILQREVGNTADVAGLEISKPATLIDGAEIGPRTGSLCRFWVLSGTQGGGVCATPTLGPSSQGEGAAGLSVTALGETEKDRGKSANAWVNLGQSQRRICTFFVACLY